jgi:CHAD domain-containing protein
MVFEINSHARLPDDYKSEQIDQLLAGKFAFTAAPSMSEKWTFFDTYDWRLYDRSLVLRQAAQELILEHLSSGELWQSPASHSEPEFVWDLPESLLRKRLESVIKMRALLPLAKVNTSSIVYRILNADEKTVARLIMTETRMLDGEDATILVSYLSLRSVRGYPKYTRMLARHLKQLPKVSSPIDDLYHTALKLAGKKPGSYSRNLEPRLKPQMRSDAATKEILCCLYEVMRANESGIKADIDTEFLHDYRIAIRRTRSALSQIRNVFPIDKTEHFKQSFRQLGQITNELRDLDVYLLSEGEFEARLPEAMREDIVSLFDYLRLLREQALEEVIDYFSSDEYSKLLEEWEIFLNEPVPQKLVAANAAQPTIQLARKRIYKRYRRVIKDGDYILTHVQDELLHSLRIECKKLRYLMEFFSSLFPRNKMARLITQLKKLQDNLGEFNDLSVQQEYLMHTAEELPLDDPRSQKALVGIGYLIESLNNEQKKVKKNFAKTFKKFASPANQKSFHQLFAKKGKGGGR